MNGFEEEWRRLLENAREAKAAFMAEEGNSRNARHLEQRMYAANSAVREFVRMEKRISGKARP